MKCASCGCELNPNGAWLLGDDEVCQPCYEYEVGTEPEATFSGIAAGVTLGLLLWFGLFYVLASAGEWIRP